MNVGIFDGSPSCKIISIMEVTAWNVFFRHLKKGGYLLTYIHTPAKKYHWQWHHVLFQIEWGAMALFTMGDVWNQKSISSCNNHLQLFKRGLSESLWLIIQGRNYLEAQLKIKLYPQWLGLFIMVNLTITLHFLYNNLQVSRTFLEQHIKYTVSPLSTPINLK